MYRRITVFAFVLVLMFSVSPVFAADKFAYVDLSRIFSEYGKTKDYDKVLSDKEQVFSTERDKKLNDVKQFQEKLNILSEKEKATKKTELETKVKAFQEFDRQQQTDLRKDQNDKMGEILKDIEEAVKQYAEKEGYSMVFNDRVLVYQTKSMDITTQIIDILNKGYKK
ncbi:MAG: OmpH family outer membrane protein [Candidatus Omnitrophica bacterium]|nr:OmpH family outer membrane protein [Candidatus Omnitrophota bacterium]MBI5145476.1 OmpH family outer membrane protein [Candidatus Omnitrophota bacterium]